MLIQPAQSFEHEVDPFLMPQSLSLKTCFHIDFSPTALFKIVKLWIFTKMGVRMDFIFILGSFTRLCVFLQ